MVSSKSASLAELEAVPADTLELNQRLRLARLRSGLSFKELAPLTGKAHQTLYSYEVGTYPPAEAALPSIASALSVPLEFLRTGRIEEAAAESEEPAVITSDAPAATSSDEQNWTPEMRASRIAKLEANKLVVLEAIPPHTLTIGSRIKLARLRRGMSYEDVGAFVGRSVGTVKSYEKQDAKPTKEVFALLSNALGVSVTFLRTGRIPGVPKPEAIELPDATKIAATELPDEAEETPVDVIETFLPLPVAVPLAEALVSVLESPVFHLVADKGEPFNTIPMILHCPACHTRHIDEGRFAEIAHHTHACQSCGMVWRPAKVNTHGVQFLPGYFNE